VLGGWLLHTLPYSGHNLIRKKKTMNKDFIQHDDYLRLEEPRPKTGWDLYITPDFTLNNAKPVNWFNRKMQELILGFKWKRQ
jgi:hypothetical protein